MTAPHLNHTHSQTLSFKMQIVSSFVAELQAILLKDGAAQRLLWTLLVYEQMLLQESTALPVTFEVLAEWKAGSRVAAELLV